MGGGVGEALNLFLLLPCLNHLGRLFDVDPTSGISPVPPIYWCVSMAVTPEPLRIPANLHQSPPLSLSLFLTIDTLQTTYL